MQVFWCESVSNRKEQHFFRLQFSCVVGNFVRCSEWALVWYCLETRFSMNRTIKQTAYNLHFQQ